MNGYTLFTTLDPDKVAALEDFYKRCNISKERLIEAVSALQAFGLTMAACAKAINSSSIVIKRINNSYKRLDVYKSKPFANSNHKPRQIRMRKGKK